MLDARSFVGMQNQFLTPGIYISDQQLTDL